MKIEPLQDYVLLENKPVLVGKGKDKPVFIIPDEVQAGIDQAGSVALVVSTGPDVKSALKKGEEVMIKKYKFDEFTFEKKKYYLGKEEGIIAKVYDKNS